MKKITLLLFLTLSFYSCKKDKNTEVDSTKNEITSQWSEFGLLGNVISISEYTTEENRDGKIPNSNRKFENQFSQDVSLKFDENGKLINKLVYGESGNVIEDIVYDGFDKIITIKKNTSPTEFNTTKYTWEGDNNTIITRRYTDGSLLDKEVFQFDKGLKINRLKFNSNDKQTDRIAYSYDANKRLTEEKYFRDKPTIQSSLAIEYDENGNKVVEASYDKDYKLIWKTSFTYNSENLLLNSKTYNTDGALENELFRTYDSEYRLITKGTNESFDNSRNKEEFEYDDNNNTTSWKIYKNDRLISHTFYNFENKNNLTLQYILDSNNQEIYRKEISYTYDNHNNWINKKTTINNDLVLLTSRKIEYFK